MPTCDLVTSHRPPSLSNLRLLLIGGQFVVTPPFIPHQIKDYGVGIPFGLAKISRKDLNSLSGLSMSTIHDYKSCL